MGSNLLSKTRGLFSHKLLHMKKLCSLCRVVKYSSCVHSAYPIIPKLNSNFHHRTFSMAVWTKVVSDAEKVVGYPTSFLSLKYLLSDEISNIAVHLRKLVGSNHPILKTAKKLLSDSHSSLNPRGLIILLLSKIGNEASNMSDNQKNEILKKQRSLAEIVGMIYTVQLIHTSLIDAGPNARFTTVRPSDVDFGNKISILSGDYLLANASLGLSKLRNTKVVELIAEAIQDFTKAKFLSNQFTLEENVKLGLQRWERRSYLSCGSLLDKSCRSALELANVTPDLALFGSEIGKNVGLAWQARMELENVLHSENVPTIDILSLPVLLHLKEDKELLNLIKSSNNHDTDLLCKIREKVLNGNGPKKTRELGVHYCTNACQLLSTFPQSGAQLTLKKLIQGFHEIPSR